MEINLTLVVFASSLHDSDDVSNSREALYSDFKRQYSLKVVSAQEYEPIKGQEEFAIAFIATGGTEELFLNHWQKISRPLIILSDSFHNSLAASLEISSWLSYRNIKHKHLNFPIEPTSKYMKELHNEIHILSTIHRAFKEITNTKIGLIGGMSPWLIASDVDRYSLSSKFGVRFVDIPISKIEELYNKKIPPKTTRVNNSEKLKQIIENHTQFITEGIEEEEVVKAIKIYDILMKLVLEHEINALTIKCFDILKSCNTTACLALALLNDKAIVSGCEGDIPALWSMIIARALLNTAAFMANPSSIDKDKISVDFAHCTSPLSLASNYSLPSHYESGIGLGVAAHLEEGDYTLFKIGGESLDRYFCASGRIVKNTAIKERCRTQVKFNFESQYDFNTYLNLRLGNHMVLIPGNHKATLDLFFDLY